MCTLLLLVGGCGYDDFEGLNRGDFRGVDIMPNTFISTLRGVGFENPWLVGDSLIIGGYVTATDESGNFYRSFIVDDGTGAVEIRAGFYDLHTRYHLGQRVVMRIEGLGIDLYHGVLQVGAAINPYSFYRVEEFGSPAMLGKYLTADTLFRRETPPVRRVGELTVEECGRLVRIERLTFPEAHPATWAVGEGVGIEPVQGVRKLVDSEGAAVSVVTSGYADFADREIPRGVFSVTGILMYGPVEGGDKFYLKLRDGGDVDD